MSDRRIPPDLAPDGRPVGGFAKQINDLRRAVDGSVAQRPGVEWLNQAEREDFEERSAILEFDAGMPRDQAEAYAMRLVLRQRTLQVRP